HRAPAHGRRVRDPHIGRPLALPHTDGGRGRDKGNGSRTTAGNGAVTLATTLPEGLPIWEALFVAQIRRHALRRGGGRIRARTRRRRRGPRSTRRRRARPARSPTGAAARHRTRTRVRTGRG